MMLIDLTAEVKLEVVEEVATREFEQEDDDVCGASPMFNLYLVNRQQIMNICLRVTEEFESRLNKLIATLKFI
jgi:hypothetical protein